MGTFWMKFSNNPLGSFKELPSGYFGGYFWKIPTPYPLGKSWVNCFRTLHALSMDPLGNWPLAPSGICVPERSVSLLPCSVSDNSRASQAIRSLAGYVLDPVSGCRAIIDLVTGKIERHPTVVGIVVVYLLRVRRGIFHLRRRGLLHWKRLLVAVWGVGCVNERKDKSDGSPRSSESRLLSWSSDDAFPLSGKRPPELGLLLCNVPRIDSQPPLSILRSEAVPPSFGQIFFPAPLLSSSCSSSFLRPGMVPIFRPKESLFGLCKYIKRYRTTSTRKSSTHWGQGVVSWASTSQIYHKEMDKVPSQYPPSIPQAHSGFSKPIFLQFSQHRKWSVHSQCSRSCDWDFPIRKILIMFKNFPKNVTVMFWSGSFKEFFMVFPAVWLQCSQPVKLKMSHTGALEMFLSDKFRMSLKFHS